MSEWLLLNTNSALFQLYHGENTLIFNEMMVKIVSDLREVGGFPDTLVSCTNKIDRHDITEILWNVVLNSMTLYPYSNPSYLYRSSRNVHISTIYLLYVCHVNMIVQRHSYWRQHPFIPNVTNAYKTNHSMWWTSLWLLDVVQQINKWNIL